MQRRYASSKRLSVSMGGWREPEQETGSSESPILAVRKLPDVLHAVQPSAGVSGASKLARDAGAQKHRDNNNMQNDRLPALSLRWHVRERLAHVKWCR